MEGPNQINVKVKIYNAEHVPKTVMIVTKGWEYDSLNEPISEPGNGGQIQGNSSFPWNEYIHSEQSESLYTPHSALQFADETKTRITGLITGKVAENANWHSTKIFQSVSEDSKGILYVLLCYSSSGNQPQSDKDYTVEIDIEDPSLAGITDVEAYLFHDDPFTSRGTKVTVQSSTTSTDVSEKTLGETN